MKHISQTTIKKFAKVLAVFAVVILVASASRLYATWTNPTLKPANANRAPFLNTGGTTQRKDGPLGIGGAPTAGADFEVIGGVANLLGGFNFSNASGGPAAIINTDMYVGFNTPTTPNPGGLEIHGSLIVDGIVRDGSLAHSGVNPQETVCVTANGVLIPCMPPAPPAPCVITETMSCEVLSSAYGTAAPGSHDQIRCASTIESTTGNHVSEYELEKRSGTAWVPVATTIQSFPSAPTYVGSGALGTSFYTVPFRVRGAIGSCKGPWYEFNPILPGSGSGSGGI